MRVLILGAAAGGGLPQWNCGCPNCVSARSGDIEPQSQSSVAVSADGESWVVLNASPDIRTQLLAAEPLYPGAIRGTPVSAVVLTNGDIDHIAGLLILREKTAFDVYATGEILGVLSENAVFGVLDPDHVVQKKMRIGKTFEPAEGLSITPYNVPGKVPLYQEKGDVDTALISENTIGLEVKANGKTMQYVPGCAMLTKTIKERFASSDQLLFDGTVWQNDEMKTTSTGIKTGRRMGHIPISGDDGSLAQLADVQGPAKTYIHINNTNPIWNPKSPERRALKDAGWSIAYDGMEIVL
ncbi:MAG: pyrroloquinoline quinone biosynthesis protein PqqB [Roseobacter sp.]|uniref:pyrroloquinoline quinone biosynthesis protein PqqB n=1 Tax=Tateyamaria sp. TaxID=1929288 RepID=UPI0032711164